PRGAQRGSIRRRSCATCRGRPWSARTVWAGHGRPVGPHARRIISPMTRGAIRRLQAVGCGALLVFFASLCVTPAVRVVTPTDLPARISDQAFWHLVAEFSEPGGFFRSDNLVSNETTFQHVIPELQKRTRAGGVYLGVGPDQNFTYILALRPALSFIVDVRRQNMLLHLMYK